MSNKVPTDDAPVVGVGHPEFQQLLSQDDERRLDEKGRQIVHRKPWADTPTGLYLCVLVSKHKDIGCDRPVFGKNLQVGTTDAWLGLFVTTGRPTFNQPYWGACLELPADLGEDTLKIQYVTEWFVNTVHEAFEGARVNRGVRLGALKEMSAEITVVIDDAITRAGL